MKLSRINAPAVILSLLSIISLETCQSLPPIPEPIAGKTSTALVISLHDSQKDQIHLLRLPAGSKADSGGEIVTATFAADNRFYIFNAQPGEYMVAGFRVRDIAAVTGVLNRESAEKTRFVVVPGKMNYFYLSPQSAGPVDEWATAILARLSPGAAFSKNGFRRAHTSGAEILKDGAEVDRLKAEVAGDLGNSPWSALTCPTASCRSTDHSFSVDEQAPPSSVVTVANQSCFHVYSIEIGDAKGITVIHTPRPHFSSNFTVPPGRIFLKGRCLVGNASTGIYAIDLGTQLAGQKTTICTKIDQKFFSNTGKVETRAVPSQQDCDTFRGVSASSPSE